MSKGTKNKAVDTANETVNTVVEKTVDVNAGTDGTNGTESTEDGDTDSQTDGTGNAVSNEKPAEKSVEGNAGAIKATKKQPPLKNGKRSGAKGGRTSGGKATYNFAEASYSDVTNFVRHIVNGAWVPVYNGHPAKAVDANEKVYSSLEDAIKGGAIEFGYRTDIEHVISYKQNIQLVKAGCTNFTSLYKPGVYGKDGKVITEPVQSYHCFLTASSMEDIQKAKQYMAAYDAANPNQKSMITKWLPEPYLLTFPPAPATLGVAAPAPVAPVVIEGETAVV